MATSDVLAALLDAWRRAIARTGTTKSGSVARQDAERGERRARWAYEDESVRQHAEHGRPESLRHRMQRASGRLDALRQDYADRTARPGRLADERETQRELGEPADDDAPGDPLDAERRRR